MKTYWLLTGLLLARRSLISLYRESEAHLAAVLDATPRGDARPALVVWKDHQLARTELRISADSDLRRA